MLTGNVTIDRFVRTMRKKQLNQIQDGEGFYFDFLNFKIFNNDNNMSSLFSHNMSSTSNDQG